MYDADHISAVRRNFESRAMPEIEKPPARLVDIYYAYLYIKMKLFEMNVKNNKNKTIQIKYICYNKQAPRVWLKKNEKNV